MCVQVGRQSIGKHTSGVPGLQDQGLPLPVCRASGQAEEKNGR
jgi:hypothetical protein